MGSPLVKLHLVDRPHGTLDVLHPHETLVERQVVTNSVLRYETQSEQTSKRIAVIAGLLMSNHTLGYTPDNELAKTPWGFGVRSKHFSRICNTDVERVTQKVLQLRVLVVTK